MTHDEAVEPLSDAEVREAWESFSWLAAKGLHLREALERLEGRFQRPAGGDPLQMAAALETASEMEKAAEWLRRLLRSQGERGEQQ